MPLLLTMIVLQLSGWLGFKWARTRAEKKAEFARLHPFKQNPFLDKLLRRYCPVPGDKRQRWAAECIKTTVRNFVNSESFSIAVDGLVAEGARRLKESRSSGLRSVETKLGGEQGLARLNRINTLQNKSVNPGPKGVTTVPGSLATAWQKAPSPKSSGFHFFTGPVSLQAPNSSAFSPNSAKCAL